MDKFFTQVAGVWSAMALRKKLTLLIVIALTAGSFAALLSWTGRPDFQNLYAGLAPEDAGVIMERIRDDKIPYRITDAGGTIQVPREWVYELRMRLASHGLPQSAGIGFEVFDNTKLGMTEFVQNVNYQRALQGELARTINRIDEIESARVHLVMPEKSLFMEDEKPASASVVLKMRPGRQLAKTQIQGIVHLVSSSIAGLEPDSVTVVDNRGKLLAGKDNAQNLDGANTDQFVYQQQMEKSLETRVKSMLEEVLGPNKAIVRVSCELDFMRHEQTEEMYLPENQVVRSEQALEESTSSAAAVPMGIPGLPSNTVSGYIGTGSTEAAAGSNDSGTAFRKQDRTRNYEIGKIVAHKVMPYAKLQRISTAVIVDGTYQLVAAGKKKEKQWEYTPRTGEEMGQFASIVKRAISFDADRGDKVEIENIPFETAKIPDEEPDAAQGGWRDKLADLRPLMEYAFAGVFLLMTFLFLVRPLVRWLTAERGDATIIRQLPKTIGEIEREMGAGTAALPYRDQVRQLIAGDSQASAGVVKEWMSQE
jgi:flagellar M-ring protein FliF